MTLRSRILDDLAGLAGGALSLLAGARDEARAVRRSRRDAALRGLGLARRDDLDAVREMAARAREGQAAAEARLAAIEARLDRP